MFDTENGKKKNVEIRVKFLQLLGANFGIDVKAGGISASTLGGHLTKSACITLFGFSQLIYRFFVGTRLSCHWLL